MSRAYRLAYQNHRIIIFETTLTAIILSVLLWMKLGYHWSVMIITFLVIGNGFYFLFFRLSIFRYIVTLLFSMGYGVIGYELGSAIQPDGVTASVIFAFMAYFFSILLHKKHFDFIKKAEVIEYQYE